MDKRQYNIDLSGAEMSATANLLETLREVGPPAGLEWAGMVMAWWYEKNYSKIYTARPPYRFRMKDYQALALRQLLLTVGLRNLVEDAIRNGLVAELDQQLQHKAITLNSNQQKLLQ